MGFFEVLAQIIELLQHEQRISYRALKREFGLDDAYLEDVKTELIEVKQLAIDHEGKMLLWTGDSTSPSTPAPLPSSTPANRQKRGPLSYTPQHLVEKILQSRADLEGERGDAGPRGLHAQDSGADVEARARLHEVARAESDGEILRAPRRLAERCRGQDGDGGIAAASRRRVAVNGVSAARDE